MRRLKRLAARVRRGVTRIGHFRHYLRRYHFMSPMRRIERAWHTSGMVL